MPPDPLVCELFVLGKVEIEPLPKAKVADELLEDGGTTQCALRGLCYLEVVQARAGCQRNEEQPHSKIDHQALALLFDAHPSHASII